MVLVSKLLHVLLVFMEPTEVQITTRDRGSEWRRTGVYVGDNRLVMIFFI